MNLLELVTSPEAWLAFVTLSAMEIVLGIDNVIFIAILVGRIPDAKARERYRRIGLLMALVLRVGLLFAISWIMGLTTPLFTILNNGFTGRDLIMIGGGLFLIGKSAHEMYAKLEGDERDEAPLDKKNQARAGAAILVQIALIDVVFSLDSVITAVGMADSIPVMVAAMIVAVGVMLLSANAIGEFVERHPSVKILALSFLLLIGVLLLAEGFGQHISKGYVYFAMAFSLAVELINMRFRKKQKPLRLHNTTVQDNASTPA